MRKALILLRFSAASPGAEAAPRHIYPSRDGGATYRPVVDEAPGVQLVNGPTMAAHPTNRDVVHFIFGTYFQGYGTDVSATTTPRTR